MLLLTAPVLIMPMAAVTLVNKGVPARLLIMLALLLVTAGNLCLLTLGPHDTVVIAALPLLMIGVGMGVSFGITDGQAMSLVPADSVGMAAGFLNTLRGAAEAMVIAAFGAALLGFLTSRLGDGGRAAAVGSGQLTSGRRGLDAAAFTWAWHMTQLGIGILCLVLSIAVGVLLGGRRPRRMTT
jgi:hypothetical protein